MTTALLHLRGLQKAYDAVPALRWDDDDTLDVRPGEILGVIGENGAGKSTLLGILVGAVEPDAGAMSLRGEPYRTTGPFEALAQGMALIPQETLLSPTLTVAENVLLGREGSYSVAGVVKAKRRDELAKEALDALGLSTPLKAVVRDLPLEQRKLIEFARAVAAEPDVLLVDETSNVLSQDGVELLFERLHAHAEGGGGVVFVSHNLEEVIEHCDRVAVLKDGRLVTTLEVDGTIDHDTVAKLMVGRDLPTDGHFGEELQPGEELLRVEELCGKGFTEVSLTVRACEVVGIGGLVGCGAQSVARCVAGDLPPSGGRIHVRGEEVGRPTVRRLLDRGVAYVPKDRDAEGLLLTHSVRENLLLSSLKSLQRLKMLLPGAGHRSAVEISDRMRIRAAGQTSQVMTLSGGNRQKVLLGRVFLHQADVLVLDSPTRGVDVGAKREIYEAINEAKREGAGVLLISDELPELRRLADRVHIMRRGRIVATYDAPLPSEHDLIGDML